MPAIRTASAENVPFYVRDRPLSYQLNVRTPNFEYVPDPAVTAYIRRHLGEAAIEAPAAAEADGEKESQWGQCVFEESSGEANQVQVEDNGESYGEWWIRMRRWQFDVYEALNHTPARRVFADVLAPVGMIYVPASPPSSVVASTTVGHPTEDGFHWKSVSEVGCEMVMDPDIDPRLYMDSTYVDDDLESVSEYIECSNGLLIRVP